ncbi:MAG: hypothetical protein GY754_36605 [bacterium]|nr:hypothetical protein [bacterium]
MAVVSLFTVLAITGCEAGLQSSSSSESEDFSFSEMYSKIETLEAQIASLNASQSGMADGSIVDVVNSQAQQIAALESIVVPVGTIMAWHKNLGGMPSLPDNFVECDGTQISDSDSPLNGEYTPNLNNAAQSYHEGGVFLRGSTTSSNTLQDDGFQGHRHDIKYSNGAAALVPYNPGGVSTTAPNNGSNPWVYLQVKDPTSDGVNGTPRTESETRPVNMPVVWVMRIK